MLQAAGERAVDMMHMYMMMIWEVKTCPGAWALALMQQIHDSRCPASCRGIYLLNTLTKVFQGLYIYQSLSRTKTTYIYI